MRVGSHRTSIGAAGFALAVLVLGVLALWPRGPTDSDYFGPNMPTWVRVPTTVGDPVYVGVLVLNARAGDVVELASLGIDRTEGDATIEPLVRVLAGETETLGGIAASALPPTIDLSSYSPLLGFRFAEADGPVELSLRVSGAAPIHGFDGLTLRFTRNGADEEVVDRIPMRASVCAGSTFDQAVELCRPIEDQMHSFGL
jgi:hypothetical protein